MIGRATILACGLTLLAVLAAGCTVVETYGGPRGELTERRVLPGVVAPPKLDGPGRQKITTTVATLWPIPVFFRLSSDTARLDPRCGALIVTDHPQYVPAGVLNACINGGPTYVYPTSVRLPAGTDDGLLWR